MNSKYNSLDIIAFFIFISFRMPQPYHPQTLVNTRNESIILNLRAGDEGKSSEKYNSRFHCILEDHFPDWPERIAYENQQLRFYNSGRKKLITADRVHCQIHLTVQEEDARNYFEGTGFYAYHQKSTIRPNIFDTRQSFLLKMHNPELRQKFLTSYNNRTNLIID